MADQQFYTLITTAGKAKIANATAFGTKVNFNTLKVGDGNGNYYEPTESKTDLVHTVWSGPITSISTDPSNPNWIIIAVSIPADVGGFMIREVGIFDDTGTMIAIGKYPETYKPTSETGSTKDLTIKTILEVSNSGTIELKVDPNIIVATKQDFNALAGTGRTTETVKKNADNIASLGSQMADIVLNLKNPPAPIVKANGDNTDETTVIQNIINLASPGQEIIIPKGTFRFTNLIIPSVVHIKSTGGILIGGTITFSKSLAQEYNTIFERVWFKQCKFNVQNTTDTVNNIVFDKCFIDGTDINNEGSTVGTAVLLGQLSFDIKFNKTNICNYTNGIICQGNSKTDLTGTSYLATGVFISLSDTKIFNCGLGAGGYGLGVLGSCLDGTSIHLSNVLLDHCGYGLYVNNNPRVAMAGEITILGSNVRIEFCDQAIYNSRNASIFIEGIWSMGKNPSTNNHVIENNGGYMKLTGRISAPTGSIYAVYNGESGNCIIDGVLGGGLFYGAKSPIISTEMTYKNLKFLRFMLTKSSESGQITLQLIDASDSYNESLGVGFLNSSVSASFGAGGSASVGSGNSAITYKLLDSQYLTITLPQAIGKVFMSNITRSNTSTNINCFARNQAHAYIVVNFVDTSGVLADITTLPSGAYIEFAIGITQ